MNPQEFSLEVLSDGERYLARNAAVVIVELCADFRGGQFFLLLKNEFSDTGEGAPTLRGDLNTRVTRTMHIKEDKEASVWRCLSDNFEMSTDVCKSNFALQCTRDVKEAKSSPGFPGVETIYNLHIARVRMVKKCLPACSGFMTSWHQVLAWGRGVCGRGSRKNILSHCTRTMPGRLYVV